MGILNKIGGFAGLIVLISAFYLMLSGYPYVFNQLVYLPNLITNVVLTGGLLAIVFLFCNNGFLLPYTFKSCILLQVIACAIFFVIHADTSYVTRIVYILITYLLFLVAENSIGIKRIVEFNNNWIAIQAVLSLIGFVLIFIGILHSLSIFENIDGRPSSFYGIATSNVSYGGFSRMAGFFDEPGALAGWGIYALVINKLFFKNKFVEFSLIIGLISTLSLAYFIQIAIYFCFFSLNNLKVSIPVGVVFFIVMIWGMRNGGEYFEELTINRIEAFQAGEDNNRTALSNMAEAYFLKSPIIGHGAKRIEEIAYMGDNPYELLAKDGILGTFFTYLPLLIILIKKRRKEVLFSLIILVIGYFQRPFHVNFMHYFMLLSFLYLCLTENQE